MFAQGHLIISKAAKFEVECSILQNYVVIKHTPAYIWTYKVMWDDVLFNYYQQKETTVDAACVWKTRIYH
jgi:hypothetical protein